MGSITLEDARDLLYTIGVKFDRLTDGTRITLTFCYVLIIIACATLNSIYLHVFITKPKLRKPSNMVVSSLLFNSMLLLLTVLPLTLLEICNNHVAKSHNVVSVQKYITLSYIWLSFTTVAHIGYSRCTKIKSGLVNLDYHKYWKDILLFAIGAIFSALMPLTTVVIFFYYGMRATSIFNLVKFTTVTLILLASYVVIMRKVKNSNKRLKGLQNNSRTLHQQERTLRKVRKTVCLIVGGYILTLVPFTCSCAIEMYSFYNEGFKKDNELFANTFSSVGEMILYMNSIFNAIIYFHTNTEFCKELKQLGIVKQTNITVKSLKSLVSRTVIFRQKNQQTY